MSTHVSGIPSLDAIAKDLAASEKQVERALSSAIRKTNRWAGDEGRSGIARTIGIRLSAMKGRVSVYVREYGGKTWFGLNDIPSSRLNPRQTATGATMDGMKGEVAHGFVARARNGRRFVFIRQGKARLPITMVGLPISDLGQRIIENDIFPQVEDRLAREFETELRAILMKEP